MTTLKKQQQKIFLQNIYGSIKKLFQKHNKKVRDMNEDKREKAGIKPDKIEGNFIHSCIQIKQTLIELMKILASNDKIRKEKKDSYNTKLNQLGKAIEQIQKKKNIPLKINKLLQELPIQILKGLKDIIKTHQAYVKGGGIFACGSNDLKGPFQVKVNDLTERAFLLKNLMKLQSKTNDKITETFLPIQFQQSFFSSIGNDIQKLWPAPVIIKQEHKPQVAEKEITYVQVPVTVTVKEQDKLREAHQLLFGFGRSQDVQSAIKLYQEEANKNDINAINCLGTIYEEGKYIPKDLKKATNFFWKSAQQKNPEGLYKIGLFLERGLIKSKELFSGKYPNRQSEIRGAIQYLESAAKLGHLDAITDLGYIYEKGIKNYQTGKYFIDPHLEYAQKYYLKAKKQNFPRSYNNLGVFYLKNPNFGQIVEGDNNRKAVKYLQKAIDLGYIKAYVNLGKCYENGQIIEKNINKARNLYQEGMQRGDIDAKLALALSLMSQTLNDEKKMIQISEMIREILVVDKQNSEARFYMGILYEKGIGIEKNSNAAFYNIQVSAKSGYPPAINKLGDYYFSGFGCKKQKQIAIQLYEKAASEGYTQSYVNLGILYEKGEIISQNKFEKALQYYQKAANGGNDNALVNIGLLTFQKNSKEDYQQYFKKAADMGNIHAMKLLTQTIKMPKMEDQIKQNNKNTMNSTNPIKFRSTIK